MFIPPRLPTFHPKLCRLQNYFLLLLLTRKFKTLSFILHTYACLFQQYCTLPCESNNALSLVFLVTKRDEVTGECRRLLNPSAWGHLNPSSYCDVGRLFTGNLNYGLNCREKNEEIISRNSLPHYKGASSFTNKREAA